MYDEPTLEDYIAMLRDPDPDVRRNAAWILGRQRDIRIVAPLITAVHDADSNVRVRVVEALGNLKDERVVEPLVAALQSDTEAEVRAYAAQSLGHTGDPRAVEPLMAALEDGQSQVRTAAAGALGQLHDPRATDSLVARLLHDENQDVWYYAARSLVEIGGARTVDALLGALNQAEPGATVYIIETLGQLYDRRAIEPLAALVDHEDEGIRETARWALKQLGYRQDGP